MEKTRLDELYIYIDENFLLKVIFEKLKKKMLKIAYFANFGPKYLGPQIFPRHAVLAGNSKYGRAAHIFELGYTIFNEGAKRESKM